MRLLLISLLCGAALLPSRSVSAQPSSSIAVIPQPVKVTERSGRFALTGRTAVWTDTAAAAIGRQFAAYVEPATGFTLRVHSGGAAPASPVPVTIHSSPPPAWRGRDVAG